MGGVLRKKGGNSWLGHKWKQGGQGRGRGMGGAKHTLMTARRPRCSVASWCSTGSIIRQGPHHEALKSTSTSCTQGHRVQRG